MKRPPHPGFMVWNPNGYTPRYQHPTLEEAKAEAKRLAGVQPGQPFFILAPIGGAVVDRPEAIVFSLPLLPEQHERGLDGDIPF